MNHEQSRAAKCSPHNSSASCTICTQVGQSEAMRRLGEVIELLLRCRNSGFHLPTGASKGSWQTCGIRDARSPLYQDLICSIERMGIWLATREKGEGGRGIHRLLCVILTVYTNTQQVGPRLTVPTYNYQAAAPSPASTSWASLASAVMGKRNENQAQNNKGALTYLKHVIHSIVLQ